MKNALIWIYVKRFTGLKGVTLFSHLFALLILLTSLNVFGVPASQGGLVTGVVTDATTKVSIPGVNVIIQGTQKGTVTDADGKYRIEISESGATLVFSFIGYNTESIEVGNKKVINIAMLSDTKSIEEVVAVGYGTTKRATVTGSISTINGTKLQAAPSINISNSLAGRLPGLVAVSRSGEPGYDGATLRIRGSNTLGDNSPLIVVDGISNRSLEGISSADIESITILKDASAAIYGAQAANGVILVTTKRGLEGKPEISISLNQGWSSPTVLPKMTDASTYAQMVNEIDLYRSRPATFSQDQIQKYKDGSDPWLYPNTDWFAEVYKPLALQKNVNFSLSGGTDKLKYFFSAGYKYQDGNYNKSATNYSQADFRSNIDGKISDNIKLSIGISGRQENRNYSSFDAGRIFVDVMRAFPTQPAYWPNGLPGPDIERGENPVVMVTSDTGYDKDIRYIMESNVKLDITIPWVKGLSLMGNASIDKNFQNRKLWQTPWSLYTWDRQTYDANNVPSLVKGSRGYSEPRLTQSMADSHRTTLNALINYDHSFSNAHNIKILAGVERIEGESMNFWAYRRYFISTAVQELFAGGDLQKDNSGSASSSARLNYFGRVNYNYLQKYMAEFVWRYDGSYIFPAESRFGFFPGISLGWRISEEEFWKENMNFINYFKLRGSWGQTGNDRIETYQYLSSYGFGHSFIFDNDLETKTMHELRVPNPNVTWEVANQTNIGFDAKLLGDKLTLSADYFYNLRTNILWWRNASVPSTTGLSLPRENIGKVANQGFEFEIGYNNSIRDFKYEISFNAAYQNNKIIFWDETPGIPDYQKSTGRPMNSQLYYQAIGIFKDQDAVNAYPHWANARPGDIIFEDVNKDGKIDALDQVRNDKTDMPKITGGLNINLSYKNFYSAILFQGAAEVASYFYYSEEGTFGNFMQDDSEGRWTADNTDASKPRTMNYNEEYWRSNRNTYYLKNADYLRLKNIEIGYNVPGAFNNKLGIKLLRIYFNGQNLLTFTKLKNVDPETNSYYIYPPLKVYNIGVSLTF
jgi:TonB-linked SusC/RagA family outer membrane protein